MVNVVYSLSLLSEFLMTEGNRTISIKKYTRLISECGGKTVHVVFKYLSRKKPACRKGYMGGGGAEYNLSPSPTDPWIFHLKNDITV
jgi:hypothetical protein